MAPPAKQPMSGLRSVKRDFSSNSLASASQGSATSESDAIPWDPTPPKKLSGLEQRLKDIQDALNAQISSSQTTLSQSQKRPAPSSDAPSAKRRQLPPSREAKPTPPAQNSTSTYSGTASSSRAFGAARQVNTNETLVVPSASKSTAASKPAPVFL
ncbi:hypothetical protein PYCCODRAFT_1472809, partial [Trametes coccinea BRFM310]